MCYEPVLGLSPVLPPPAGLVSTLLLKVDIGTMEIAVLLEAKRLVRAVEACRLVTVKRLPKLPAVSSDKLQWEADELYSTTACGWGLEESTLVRVLSTLSGPGYSDRSHGMQAIEEELSPRESVATTLVTLPATWYAWGAYLG